MAATEWREIRCATGGRPEGRHYDGRQAADLKVASTTRSALRRPTTEGRHYDKVGTTTRSALRRPTATPGVLFVVLAFRPAVPAFRPAVPPFRPAVPPGSTLRLTPPGARAPDGNDRATVPRRRPRGFRSRSRARTDRPLARIGARRHCLPVANPGAPSQRADPRAPASYAVSARRQIARALVRAADEPCRTHRVRAGSGLLPTTRVRDRHDDSAQWQTP